VGSSCPSDGGPIRLESFETGSGSGGVDALDSKGGNDNVSVDPALAGLIQVSPP